MLTVAMKCSLVLATLRGRKAKRQKLVQNRAQLLVVRRFTIYLGDDCDTIKRSGVLQSQSISGSLDQVQWGGSGTADTERRYWILSDDKLYPPCNHYLLCKPRAEDLYSSCT